MSKKNFSIDIVSYFYKFLILICLCLVSYFAITNIYELCEILFSKLERKLCTYSSIIDNNNLVSDFFILHFPETYGSYSHVFLKDSSISVLGITIFLRLFEIFKYIYLGVIGLFTFKLFNNYSKNKIIDNQNNKYLLIISILIISIPFIYLLRDFIGCLIINNLPIDEKNISFLEFKFYYLIVGITTLFIHYKNYLKLNNIEFKNFELISKICLIILATYCLILFVSNSINLIGTFTLKDEASQYYELIKARDPFIKVLISNNFELFGRNWTYLGIDTDLKGSMIFYYSSNILIYSSLIYLFIKSFINYNKFDLSKLLFYILIIIFVLIVLCFINNLIIVNAYNKQKTPNPNLEYSLFNVHYLPIFILTLTSIIYSLSIKTSRD